MTLLAPIMDRIQHADPAMKLGAVVGGFAQLLLPDAFFWIFLILVGSNLADWMYGRQAAMARRNFDGDASRHGLVGKTAQLTIILLLRALEGVLPLLGLPATFGMASAALALALIVEDLESLERHVVTLGGRKIPGLSPVLRQIRMVTGGDRRNPGEAIPPAGQGMRRREKDPGADEPPHHEEGQP